jgi:hypothetical protein
MTIPISELRGRIRPCHLLCEIMRQEGGHCPRSARGAAFSEMFVSHLLADALVLLTRFARVAFVAAFGWRNLRSCHRTWAEVQQEP